jgi:replicative superfamily II helicase
VVPTGSGKTRVSYIFLGKAIADGYVGVYLVPHTQLLDQKVAELSKFFGDYVHLIKMSGVIF